VTKGWRKFHNEELHNLNSSHSVIILIKFKKIETGSKIWTCWNGSEYDPVVGFVDHSNKASGYVINNWFDYKLCNGDAWGAEV
jgi:hypothetical protein